MKKKTCLFLVLLLMLTSMSGFASVVPVEPTPVYGIQLDNNTLNVEADASTISVSIPVVIEKDSIALTDEEVLADPNLRLYVLADYSDGSDTHYCDVNDYSNNQAHLNLPTEGVIGYSLYVEALEESAWVQIRFTQPTITYSIFVESNNIEIPATNSIVSVSVPVQIQKNDILMTDEEVLADPEIRLYVLADHSDGTDAHFCDVSNYSDGQAHLNLPTEDVIGYSMYIEAPEENAWVQIRFTQPQTNGYEITLSTNSYEIQTNDALVPVSIPVQIYHNGNLMTDDEVLNDENLVLYFSQCDADGNESFYSGVTSYVDSCIEMNLWNADDLSYILNIKTLDGSEISKQANITFLPIESEFDLSLIDFQYDQFNYNISEETETAVLDIPVRFYYNDVQLTDDEVLNGGMIQMKLEKKLIGESSYQYVSDVANYQDGVVHLELPTKGIETYELLLIASDGVNELEEGISIIFDWQVSEEPTTPVNTHVTTIDINQNEYLFPADASTVNLDIPVRFMSNDTQLTDEEVLTSSLIRMYLFKHPTDMGWEYHSEADDYSNDEVLLSLPTEGIDAYVLNIEVDDGGEGLQQKIFIRQEEVSTTPSYLIQYIGNYEWVYGKLYLEQDEPLQIRLLDGNTNEDITNLHELSISGIDGATVADGIIHFPPVTESWGYTSGRWSILVDEEEIDEQSYLRYIGTLGHIQVLDPNGLPTTGEMNIYYALVNPEGTGSLYRNYSNNTTDKGVFYFPINTDRTNIAVFGFAVSPFDLDTPYANSPFVNYTDYLATTESVIDFGTVSLQEPHYIAKLVDQSGNPMPGMVTGDLNAYYEDPETGLSFRFIVKTRGYGDGELAFANVYDDKMPPYQTDELVMWAIENQMKFEVADFIMPAEYTIERYQEPSVSLTGTLYSPDGTPVDPSMEFHVIAEPIDGKPSVSVWSNGPFYEFKGLSKGQYLVWAVTEHEWQKSNGIALLDSKAEIVDYDGINPAVVDLTMRQPHVMGSIRKDGVPLADRELAINLYNVEGRMIDHNWVMGSEFFLGSYNLVEEGDYMVEITNSTQDLRYGGQFIPVHLVPGEIVDLGSIELEEAKVTGQILADGFSGTANNMRGVYVNIFDPDGNFIKFAKTNSTGQFSIGGLPAGQYLLEAYVSPYANAANQYMSSKKQLLEFDGNIPQYISLELETIAYTGQLTDPFGNSLANQWVKIFDENKNLLSIVKSGNDGIFKISYLDGNPGWLQGLGNDTYLDSKMIRAEEDVIVPLEEVQLFGQITNMTMPTEVLVTNDHSLWLQTIDAEDDGSFRLGGLEPGAYKIYFLTEGVLTLTKEITITDSIQQMNFILPSVSGTQVTTPLDEGIAQFIVDGNIVGLSAIENGHFAVSDAVTQSDLWIFSGTGLEQILRPEEWVGASDLNFASMVPFSGRIIGQSFKYRVYVYDENWNLQAMQKTNLLGEFTFGYIKPGIIHIQVSDGTDWILTKQIIVEGPTQVDLDVR